MMETLAAGLQQSGLSAERHQSALEAITASRYLGRIAAQFGMCRHIIHL